MPQKALQTYHIATQTHGRYCLSVPENQGPWPLLMGLHGYAEKAETQMQRLVSIEQAQAWMLLCPQALNAFYTPGHADVVAGWMTRQDRDIAITDNIAYLSSLLDIVLEQYAVPDTIAILGYSQGAAQAWRLAAMGPHSCAGVIAISGDLPEELTTEDLAKIPSALLIRGREDAVYKRDLFLSDARRLEEAGVPIRTEEIEGEHDWETACEGILSKYLQELWESELKEVPNGSMLGTVQKERS